MFDLVKDWSADERVGEEPVDPDDSVDGSEREFE